MNTCDYESAFPETIPARGIEGFRVARYEFVIEALETLSLPDYKGSTLRGGFGAAFRNVSCSARKSDCRTCVLKPACPYAYVFETAPPEGSEVLKKFEHVPHPFVLEPPQTRKREFAPGEEIPFGLVLIGRGIEFLPYFIVAFQEFGRTGIGRGRGRFRLARIYSTIGRSLNSLASPPLAAAVDDRDESGSLSSTTIERRLDAAHGPLIFDGQENKVYTRDTVISWDDIQETATALLTHISGDTGRQLAHGDPTISNSGPHVMAPRVMVVFQTMTRLKFQGGFEDRPEFHILVRSLLRRISSLLYFHHETRLDIDFRGFISRAEGVHLVAHDTHWVDWERYSSRQDARMKLGGIVGTAVYEFKDMGSVVLFLPWLVLGQYVHAGKGATFGLGQLAVMSHSPQAANG
ncbi:MAG: CRISPR system precrRNA processing endoribonuclease RAMP protein Cas6 [Firmicutes bacterium]|nr:CRISPR system precrRNA processing endoribonuclease RAMP protein Cas6 [Bacillota bacterium]